MIDHISIGGIKYSYAHAPIMKEILPRIQPSFSSYKFPKIHLSVIKTKLSSLPIIQNETVLKKCTISWSMTYIHTRIICKPCHVYTWISPIDFCKQCHLNRSDTNHIDPFIDSSDRRSNNWNLLNKRCFFCDWHHYILWTLSISSLEQYSPLLNIFENIS